MVSKWDQAWAEVSEWINEDLGVTGNDVEKWGIAEVVSGTVEAALRQADRLVEEYGEELLREVIEDIVAGLEVIPETEKRPMNLADMVVSITGR